MEDESIVDDAAKKMVSTVRAYAEMRAYNHFSDYSKKYAQRLQRDLNDVTRKAALLEKKGVNGQKYAELEMEKHVLQFQILKAQSMEIDFMKEAIRVSETDAMSTEEMHAIMEKMVNLQ